ncbi:MAG TPA: hypothetical protein VKE92_11395, partial [Anaerolineales bacterium]|nr:hypothetical protein [Anaerolineales bacterium]
AINSHEHTWLVPQRNEYQQHSILKALAVASPSELSLNQYLQRIGRLVGSHSSLLVITACADVEWAGSLMPLIWRGILPTVFLLDPISFGGKASPNAITGALQHIGVPCHVIPREMLDTPQARPGQEGEWEWRVSATGKAILVQAPIHSDWRRLG